MDALRKRLGFGLMRLPVKEGVADIATISRMVDAFLAAGFNYFDTARVYMNGTSETIANRCLSSRHPRDAFVLTDKLTSVCFKCEADIRPLFESQLAACGVDYFDFYLMHAQNAKYFEFYKSCRAYETAFELKAEGKVRHVGISFHDTPEVLGQILTEYPQIEVVQIQFNYLDYDDAAVQSRRCYEVCRQHGKPVIVMEPVKGGTLVRNLPMAAQDIFNDLGGGSPASYAIRFAAGFPGVMMVLSGMSDMTQLTDNLSYMAEPQPLTETELLAVRRVADLIRAQHLIPCTACRYCVDGCPKRIAIPDLFAVMNAKQMYHDWNADMYYHTVHTSEGRRAADCLKCGKCESVCPQHLPIRKLLEDVSREFDHLAPLPLGDKMTLDEFARLWRTFNRPVSIYGYGLAAKRMLQVAKDNGLSVAQVIVSDEFPLPTGDDAPDVPIVHWSDAIACGGGQEHIYLVALKDSMGVLRTLLKAGCHKLYLTNPLQGEDVYPLLTPDG